MAAVGHCFTAVIESFTPRKGSDGSFGLVRSELGRRRQNEMETFIVDVAYSTHDDLKEGRCEIGFRRFRILASDGQEAGLIATQWVAADRIGKGVIPTRTMICI